MGPTCSTLQAAQKGPQYLGPNFQNLDPIFGPKFWKFGAKYWAQYLGPNIGDICRGKPEIRGPIFGPKFWKFGAKYWAQILEIWGQILGPIFGPKFWKFGPKYGGPFGAVWGVIFGGAFWKEGGARSGTTGSLTSNHRPLTCGSHPR